MPPGTGGDETGTTWPPTTATTEGLVEGEVMTSTVGRAADRPAVAAGRPAGAGRAARAGQGLVQPTDGAVGAVPVPW
ncbi:hypothetical protein Col01nite_20480 [Cellulomonas oligotrophica]|uniref:Uncharacterized protein n=1 Tax=Cellulomonas oligotrophica TaxID=931536 RepID=A0ABQ4DAZ7_9CELL|nr:hypothetical protein Col01nite_20480 [Cellulomonas oligotrophica]